jgi:hypothetical protein
MSSIRFFATRFPEGRPGARLKSNRIGRSPAETAGQGQSSGRLPRATAPDCPEFRVGT